MKFIEISPIQWTKARKIHKFKRQSANRQHITDSFYNCTLEIFRGLGDLYVQDEHFTANIDKVKPGLAKFMREAMHLYCDNKEK